MHIGVDILGTIVNTTYIYIQLPLIRCCVSAAAAVTKIIIAIVINIKK